MKNISTRSRFIRVYNYNDFNKKTKNNGYQLCQQFVCSKAPILEKFFKEDTANFSGVYIVYDTNSKIVIGFYTLMATCMIREKENYVKSIFNRELCVQKSIPCIEIEKFAINERYLDWLYKNGYNNRGIGRYVFWEYISKNIIVLSGHINFSYIILYAIQHNKVIQAYKNMEFETFEDDEMNIVSMMDGILPIKESYVDDCKFMYMPLNIVITHIL